jgi:hypothetical protein
VAGVDPASPPDWPTLGSSTRTSVFAVSLNTERRAEAATTSPTASPGRDLKKALTMSPAQVAAKASEIKKKFQSRLDVEVGETGRLRTLAMQAMRLAGLVGLLFGVFVLQNVTVGVKSQEAECNARFGECVWDAIPTKLYFKENFFAGGVCGL